MDLPDELLQEVLRRVPPRRLAACRRVCKNWRDVIDSRGLVLAHLAPGPVRGMFVNFAAEGRHGFFSRAVASPSIDGSLRFLPNRRGPSSDRSRVLDHCNGLLLFRNAKATYVCNPETRQWLTLPPSEPRPGVQCVYRDLRYLVFDPTVSLHYHVMWFPEVPDKPAPPLHPRGKRPRQSSIIAWNSSAYLEKLPLSLRTSYEQEVRNVGSMEWPPYSYAVQMFSSATGQWDERRFVRQGDAVTTLSETWSNLGAPTNGRVLRCYAAVYWHGAFYLNCCGGFLMRFSLLEENYVTIKTPTLADTFLGRPRSHTDEYGKHIMPYVYLGKFKEGVYYTALQGYQLQIWVLQGVSESCQTLEWKLTHEADLKASFSQLYTRYHTGEENNKSWILDPHEGGSNDGEDHGWNSSDDCIVDAEGGVGNNEGNTKHYYGVDLLGYHPYKEIVFLGNLYNGFAYCLGSSNLQHLGMLYPTCIGSSHDMEHTINSFIYTPCKDDLLPAQNDP